MNLNSNPRIRRISETLSSRNILCWTLFIRLILLLRRKDEMFSNSNDEDDHDDYNRKKETGNTKHITIARTEHTFFLWNPKFRAKVVKALLFYNFLAATSSNSSSISWVFSIFFFLFVFEFIRTTFFYSLYHTVQKDRQITLFPL